MFVTCGDRGAEAFTIYCGAPSPATRQCILTPALSKIRPSFSSPPFGFVFVEGDGNMRCCPKRQTVTNCGNQGRSHPSVTIQGHAGTTVGYTEANRDQPGATPPPTGATIFRRADKNDDGKLSFEEFKNYFADGILSSEELWELFSGIDRRHSDNVDTEKLCDYFSTYLGEYRNVLSALEALNSAVLAAMDKTKLRYETSSKMEQFLTRFLLRETMHQLQSLQASLECAVDTMEEQAGRERKDIKKSETSVGLKSGRRCGRRGQKNVCLSPTDPYSGMLTTGVCVEDNSQWMAQINRLQQLIEKLECKSPRLEPLKEEAMCKGRDAHILVAKRQISVATSGIEEFRQAFRSYTEVTAGQSSCLHVSACKLTDEACFILYEFWQDVTSWRSHLQSSCSKTFQRSIISLLESPELLTTMLFPASWWIMNNN
ncbi:PREDICTED: N-terminal EF-hand calcium-binding protein 3 [Charadrius vociferus]|uniref:N-terminal EF-hand calcium-binding protein 3 n=1 Tax=Charadrius vociferus TaxID=50402 RepID=UPI0005214C1B|nr:PREDICTED: N-terminal EF-hand calcium-binding protein 3 [Charadrius vociferus]